MSSIFSKIISGEIPSYKLAETDNFYAFLDIFPLAKGHSLVVPKKEIDYYFDLPDELMAEMSLFCKKLALAIEKVIPCKRVGTAVVGLDIPHAHVHLIPINNVEDINFSRPKLKLSEDEFKDLAQKISYNYEKSL